MLSNHLDKRLFTQLLKLGRNHVDFLGYPSLPFFRLTDVSRTMSMARDMERKIAMLCSQAKQANIPWRYCIIRYISEETGEEEYASAVPCERTSVKRSDSSETKPGIGHIRWIRSQQALYVSEYAGNRQVLIQQHKMDPSITYESQRKRYENLGEEVRTIESEYLKSVAPMGKPMRVIWGYLGQLSVSEMDDYDPWLAVGDMKHYEPWLGDPNDAAIFIRMDQSVHRGPTIPFADLKGLFDHDALNPKSLLSNFIEAINNHDQRYIASLRAFAAINSIYSSMKQSTIDVRILERPIVESKWWDRLLGTELRIRRQMNNTCKFDIDNREKHLED